MAVKRNIVLCLVLVAGVNVYAMSRQWQWELHEQIKFEQRHAKRLEEIKEINLNNSPVGQLVKAKEFTIDGVIVSTLPYYDPFQLLKNDAHYFKYWISSYYNCCRREVENFLACLFMKAQHNNSCPQGD